MTHQKWIIIWILSSLFIPSIALFNYIVDPYGINGKFQATNYNNYKKTNTVYAYRVKTQTFTTHTFDTLLLGTSRIGIIDPNIVDNYLKSKSFNFAIPASTTEIQYKIFLYSLKFNHIKNLIYGIDFMSFNQSRTIRKNFPDFYEVQNSINNYQKLSNYDLYFNIKTFKNSLEVLYNNINKIAPIEVQFSQKNGMRLFKDYKDAVKHGTFDIDREIAGSLKLYFNAEDGIYKEYSFSKNYLNYFKKIVEHCKQHNIKLWVYIPPMQQSHLKALYSRGYKEKFERFQRELVKITNFVDFNELTQLTHNKENYWDSSHLKSKLTPLIIQSLLDESNSEKLLVTPKNIEQHLLELQREL